MGFRFVAVGTSLGGFDALKSVLGPLPPGFPAPVAVVQHRSADDSGELAPLLGLHTRLPVVEIEDKTPIAEGKVYICPPNYHVLVEKNHFTLSVDAPVLHARPSIDVFFESAADSFRSDVIGVVLSGMSKDGASGLKRIKERGGYVVVQDPQAAEGPIMPEAAIASVSVDKVLQLGEISILLNELCAEQGSKHEGG
jgi:two-component system, chemotaxis family, protein-glutamate methylesterase/glutaminase